MIEMPCPLCQHDHIEKLDLHLPRIFLFCEECKLIFVESHYRLSLLEEKNRYLLHKNTIGDKNYIAFLNQAVAPALPFIDKSMTGLDFGCGHTPVLVSLLKQRMINCEYYDPFFFPEIKQQAYDFIFSTECVEHFFYPQKTFDQMDQLLRKSGYLIIMTSFWDNRTTFGAWYYKNDPAHVAFYHLDTFDYLARHYEYKILYTDQKKVIIFQKSR